MSNKRTARAAVLFSIVMCVTNITLQPAAATNYCGNQDHGIWLIQSQATGYGSWSNIQKVNDSLVQCTSGASDGFAVATHTAGVAFDLAGSEFVEVGLYRSVNSGTIRNRVFGEYGYYPDTFGPFFYDTYSTGGTVDMKVSNVLGSFTWRLYWDDPNGAPITWTVLDSYSLSSQYGWAWGEHSRFGKTGTGGSDHHWDMQWKNSSGDWNDVNNLKCWIDSDDDWEWHDISNTEFTIQEGNRSCTPHI